MARLRGVVALAVVVAVGVASAGVTPAGSAHTAQAAATCPSPTPTERVILTVGDSITAGVTFSGAEGPSYRAELGRLLTEACVPHRFVVAAVSGTPCTYWPSRMAGLLATHQPDAVLLACGTNDRLDDKTQAQVIAWEAQYRALISGILAADPDVLVWPAWVQYSAGHPSTGCPASADPYPWWMPESEAVVNDAIFRAVTGLAAYRGRVPAVIDYQPIPVSYLDECGIHPTPGGYDVMGRLAYNTVAPRLATPPVAAVPCGLIGRRPGHPVGAWTPCQRMNLNP